MTRVQTHNFSTTSYVLIGEARVYHVRKATTNDLPELVKLECESYLYCWPPDMWNAIFDQGVVQMGLVKFGKIGFWCGIKCVEDGNSFRLLRMGIRLEDQGNGYSYMLMKNLYDYVRTRGFSRITASISEEQCGMYPELDIVPWLAKFEFKATGAIDKESYLSHGTRYDGFEFERKVLCETGS